MYIHTYIHTYTYTLWKDWYWSCFCSILVTTVDSQDGEVVLQSLLHLILMCSHIWGDTYWASWWIIWAAGDTVLVYVVTTGWFCPVQCDHCCATTPFSQCTAVGGGFWGHCDIKIEGTVIKAHCQNSWPSMDNYTVIQEKMLQTPINVVSQKSTHLRKSIQLLIPVECQKFTHSPLS